MKKFFIISLVLVTLVCGIVLATQVTSPQERVVVREPSVIPIWIGDYFTGKVVVINEFNDKYWCVLDKELMDYECKLLGGN